MTEKAKQAWEGFTPGPWKACKDGRCPCAQIWSVPADHPIATAIIGDWGDEYPTIDVEETGPSMDAKVTVTARMEKTVYGTVSEEAAAANAALIASAPDLLRENERLRSLLQTILDYNLGNGRFNFSRLPTDQRENKAFDTWQEIREEIRAALQHGEE